MLDVPLPGSHIRLAESLCRERPFEGGQDRVRLPAAAGEHLESTGSTHVAGVTAFQRAAAVSM